MSHITRDTSLKIDMAIFNLSNENYISQQHCHKTADNNYYKDNTKFERCNRTPWDN